MASLKADLAGVIYPGTILILSGIGFGQPLFPVLIGAHVYQYVAVAVKVEGCCLFPLRFSTGNRIQYALQEPSLLSPTVYL